MAVSRVVVAPADPWAAVDRIREKLASVPRPPNSFTLAEYCERYSLKEKTATYQLTSLCREGKLNKQIAIVNGKRTNVYWIPEAPCPELTSRSTSGRTGRKGRHGG